jgi:hypothetical protein
MVGKRGGRAQARQVTLVTQPAAFLSCDRPGSLRQCLAVMLADAGADFGPLWLRIVVAAIPSLVGLIGALFALTNTANRRIERLKLLTEIGLEFPRWLDPDYALERIKLRELQAIDQATTPALMWRRRFQAMLGLVFVIVITISALQFVHLVPQWHLSGRYVYLSLVGFVLVVWAAFGGERVHQQFQKRYQRGYDAIDERAEPQGEPSDDGGDENAADAPQVADSHDSKVPPDAGTT